MNSGETIELVPGRVERKGMEDHTADCRALLSQMDYVGPARMGALDAEWQASSCAERMLKGDSAPSVQRLV